MPPRNSSPDNADDNRLVKRVCMTLLYINSVCPMDIADHPVNDYAWKSMGVDARFKLKMISDALRRVTSYNSLEPGHRLRRRQPTRQYGSMT